MKPNFDPETLKIPAYLRNKAIVTQGKQKLILTALDRKEAGLKPNSKRAVAPIKPRNGQFQTSGTTTPTRRSFSRIKASARRNAARASYQPSLLVEQERLDQNRHFPTIGTVTHYIANINVAIIKMSSSLKVGEKILCLGENGLFSQTVDEIQIDRQPASQVQPGDHVGIKVQESVTVDSKIFKFL